MTTATLAPRRTAEAARRIRAVFSGYRGEHLGLRAAGLTYISIFSLVPLAVVGLVLLRGLGEEAFEQRMEHLVLRLLSPGLAESTLATLRGILTDASARVAGGVGFAALGVRERGVECQEHGQMVRLGGRNAAERAPETSDAVARLAAQHAFRAEVHGRVRI